MPTGRTAQESRPTGKPRRWHTSKKSSRWFAVAGNLGDGDAVERSRIIAGDTEDALVVHLAPIVHAQVEVIGAVDVHLAADEAAGAVAADLNGGDVERVDLQEVFDIAALRGPLGPEAEAVAVLIA